MKANRLLIHVDLDEMFPEEEPAEGQAYLHLCTDGYLIQFSTKIDGEPTPAIYEVKPRYLPVENGEEELVAIARLHSPRKTPYSLEVVQEHHGERSAMAKIMADITEAPANEDDELAEPCYGPWPKERPDVDEILEQAESEEGLLGDEINALDKVGEGLREAKEDLNKLAASTKAEEKGILRETWDDFHEYHDKRAERIVDAIFNFFK